MSTEHLLLDSLGILRQVKLPAELAWLMDAPAERQLLLDLFLRNGLSRKEAEAFQREHPEEFLNLEIRNMFEWETDKFNRKTGLVLTWRGQDAAEILVRIARNESNRRVVTRPQEKTP